MGDSRIRGVRAREILDSRGNPTVEVEVSTTGVKAFAAAPSGASTGSHEALELRDGGRRYGGKGVLRAVENVNKVIGPRLEGMDVTCLKDIDRAMIDLDGTPNKSKLGGNAIAAVSLACARAGSMVAGISLHEHLGKGSSLLPVPMMNVLNGGKHAGSNLRIQEFMIVPAGARTFGEALRKGTEVYHSLKALLRKSYGVSSINVGDEGGFAPPFDTTEQALDVLVRAIESAGYVPGKDIFLALDSAASEFFVDGGYEVDGRRLSEDGIVEFYTDLASRYPFLSFEDPVEEEAFGTMARITQAIGDRIQIVGDDIFVTNVARLRKGIEEGAGNALLLKVNQVGTVTESFEAANLAFGSGYNVVVSHRSGETEDTSIADIAVALGCGQIKTGAPARAERTTKYNRLLRIEEQLGARARFPGREAFRRRSNA